MTQGVVELFMIGFSRQKEDQSPHDKNYFEALVVRISHRIST